MNRTTYDETRTVDLSNLFWAFMVKYGFPIAAFLGSVMSLALLRPLTKKEAGASVAVGFFTAIFCTDLMIVHFGLSFEGMARNGVAYLVGLFAMNIIPVVKIALKRLIPTLLTK
jgi:hypothetical protein